MAIKKINQIMQTKILILKMIWIMKEIQKFLQLSQVIEKLRLF